MKSKIISIFLCVLVLVATFYLIVKAPTEVSDPKEEQKTQEDFQDEAEKTGVSRAFVINTAHDAEDLMEDLAYGSVKDYKKSLTDITDRLSRSAEYLKTELKDYYGATYFTKVSEIFQDVLKTPFENSALFSERVTKILIELQNAYPSAAAEELDENHPETPMYYPKFDTGPNGTTTLALLAVYRLQYQENNDCVLLTFGGNMVAGDPLLDGEKEGSFKSRYEKDSRYPLIYLSSVLLNDTATFANLETPLTESIGDTSAAGSIKGLPEYANALKKGGIDLVSIANRNVLSFGETGKTDTKKALEKAKLTYSDEGNISYYDTKIGKVAFLTYDIVDEIRADLNLTYSDAVKTDIASAKANGAKIIITHFNWVNTEKNPADASLSQILTARAAVDNGAHLVFGSHTGEMEGIERYKNVSIVYSTGDLFNRSSGSENTFLFQQAFSLDENGSVVPGQIQVLPLASSGSDSGKPSFILDAATVESFREYMRTASSTARYGVGKRADFTLDELNLITIH